MSLSDVTLATPAVVNKLDLKILLFPLKEESFFTFHSLLGQATGTHIPPGTALVFSGSLRVGRG